MKKILLSVLVVLGLSACTNDFSQAPYINSVDVTSVDFANVSSLKTGKSCRTRYFIFGPYGSNSIVEATQNANISKVTVIETKNEYGFFKHSVCTVVYGK